MDTTHIHLLLNHFPTIGFGIGLILFVVALFSRQSDLRRACLVIFFLTAALTIVTYVSGNDAREKLKEVEGISKPLMEAHESAALIAFIFMEVTGFFAWFGLWIWDRSSRFARWNTAFILIFATFTSVLMARTAYFGSAIQHSETGAAQAIPLDPSVPTLARSWGVFVLDHSWVWPACETLHFIGLCFLFGVVLIVNLRMLGIGKTMLSFAALHQLLPLGMLGFTLNLVTGMMFFVATPEQYTGLLFMLKMAMVGAGALNLMYFMLVRPQGRAEKRDEASLRTKLVAFSGIVIWVTVLFCGHMLPWLGNSF